MQILMGLTEDIQTDLHALCPRHPDLTAIPPTHHHLHLALLRDTLHSQLATLAAHQHNHLRRLERVVTEFLECEDTEETALRASFLLHLAVRVTDSTESQVLFLPVAEQVDLLAQSITQQYRPAHCWPSAPVRDVEFVWQIRKHRMIKSLLKSPVSRGCITAAVFAAQLKWVLGVLARYRILGAPKRAMSWIIQRLRNRLAGPLGITLKLYEKEEFSPLSHAIEQVFLVLMRYGLTIATIVIGKLLRRLGRVICSYYSITSTALSAFEDRVSMTIGKLRTKRFLELFWHLKPICLVWSCSLRLNKQHKLQMNALSRDMLNMYTHAKFFDMELILQKGNEIKTLFLHSFVLDARSVFWSKVLRCSDNKTTSLGKSEMTLTRTSSSEFCIKISDESLTSIAAITEVHEYLYTNDMSILLHKVQNKKMFCKLLTLFCTLNEEHVFWNENQNLHGTMIPLDRSTFPDLKILVIDVFHVVREFSAHRAVLCVRSQVFQAMLNGDFSESSSDQVELRESHQAVKFLLHWMYEGCSRSLMHGLSKSSISSLCEVLEVSNKFMLDGLFHVTELCLIWRLRVEGPWGELELVRVEETGRRTGAARAVLAALARKEETGLRRLCEISAKNSE